MYAQYVDVKKVHISIIYVGTYAIAKNALRLCKKDKKTYAHIVEWKVENILRYINEESKLLNFTLMYKS